MSESQKRDTEADGGRGSASSKRLKSSEPDLSIVCHHGDTKETLLYHSQIMAKHSNYFDTLLASGMQESESKTVALDDVDPGTFQKAVEILEDPLQSASVTAQEIMKAAPIYNRFEFSKGLKLAEAVLAKFLEGWTKQKGKSPSRQEKKLIGDSILFSQEANLEDLTQKSISFIKEKVKKGASAIDYAIFDQSFIQKINPFLEEYRVECLTELFSRVYPDTSQEKLTSADFCVDLCSWTMSSVALKQLAPFGLKIGCRPYRWTNGQLEGGAEIGFNVGRILNEDDRIHFGANGETGDWVAVIEVYDGTSRRYEFVWPCSKAFPLPPVGNQWTLASKNDEGDSNVEPAATFESLTIKTK